VNHSRRKQQIRKEGEFERKEPRIQLGHSAHMKKKKKKGGKREKQTESEKGANEHEIREHQNQK